MNPQNESSPAYNTHTPADSQGTDGKCVCVGRTLDSAYIAVRDATPRPDDATSRSEPEPTPSSPSRPDPLPLLPCATQYTASWPLGRICWFRDPKQSRWIKGRIVREHDFQGGVFKVQVASDTPGVEWTVLKSEVKWEAPESDFQQKCRAKRERSAAILEAVRARTRKKIDLVLTPQILPISFGRLARLANVSYSAMWHALKKRAGVKMEIREGYWEVIACD